MHTHCTHTPLIRASHEPPPSIHMSVSEPVGQNLCFLPGTEGSQAGVYACMCVSLRTCLRMHVNGKAFSVCRTPYSFKGKHTHTHTHTHIGHKEQSRSQCVCSCAPPLLDVRGMATTFKIILTCVPGRTCLSKIDIKIDRDRLGVMDLTVFGEGACALGSCIISYYWASPTESKTKYKIKSWFHSSQSHWTEKKKVISLLLSSFIFLCLSLFPPPCGLHKYTNARAHTQTHMDTQSAWQVFLIITVSVILCEEEVNSLHGGVWSMSETCKSIWT